MDEAKWMERTFGRQLTEDEIEIIGNYIRTLSPKEILDMLRDANASSELIGSIFDAREVGTREIEVFNPLAETVTKTIDKSDGKRIKQADAIGKKLKSLSSILAGIQILKPDYIIVIFLPNKV